MIDRATVPSPTPPTPISTGAPLVSVIIPVRDNPAGIREVLSCLRAQTLPRHRFEVIVADDGSRPEQVPSVPNDGWARVVTRPPRNSYAARNVAAEVARADALAFCDSDCLPDPAWLEEALAVLTDADLVAGQVSFVTPERRTVWTLLTVDLFLDQEQNVRLSRAVTANLVVRRQVFDGLRGFDESLPSGGDYDFVRRAVGNGARLRYAPQAAVRHPTMDDGRVFLRKVWDTNRWEGVRHVRSGKKIDFGTILTMVPFVGVALARRRALRSANRLSRARLGAASVRPSFVDDLRALAALHFVVSYVAGAGRLSGWLEGWRQARAGLGPSYRVGHRKHALESGRSWGADK